MVPFIGFLCLLAAIYFCYRAIEYHGILNGGIRTTAIVRQIEKVVELDEDGRETIRYWLHLDLPDYHGLALGKKYENPIDPKRYSIGEEVAIIQHKDAPTRILIQKELSNIHYPKTYAVFGIILFLMSYAACYLVKQ